MMNKMILKSELCQDIFICHFNHDNEPPINDVNKVSFFVIIIPINNFINSVDVNFLHFWIGHLSDNTLKSMINSNSFSLVSIFILIIVLCVLWKVKKNSLLILKIISSLKPMT